MRKATVMFHFSRKMQASIHYLCTHSASRKAESGLGSGVQGVESGVSAQSTKPDRQVCALHL